MDEEMGQEGSNPVKVTLLYLLQREKGIREVEELPHVHADSQWWIWEAPQQIAPSGG